MTEKKLSLKKTLIYSCLPALIFFGLLEGAARLAECYSPPYQDDVGLGFTAQNQVYLPVPNHPELRETHPDKIDRIFPGLSFTANKPSQVYRIFFLGGSSVHFLHRQIHSLEEALRPHLPSGYTELEILCAGGHGYGSHRLAPITQEILSYHPDMILLYCGHNEFEELEQQRFANLRAAKLQRLLNRSACCRFIRDRFADLQLNRLKQRHQDRIQAGETKPWGLVLTQAEKSDRMQQFENNLRHIIHLAQENTTPLLLGIPATNYWRPRLAEAKDAEAYEAVYAFFEQQQYEAGLSLGKALLREADRRQASTWEQEIIRELATEFGLALVDVEAAVQKAEPHGVVGETLMRDECHLNEAGNEILLQAYAAQVLDAWNKQI